MNWEHRTDIVFLGAGGDNPRFEAISLDPGRDPNFMELPPLNSVYAIGIEPRQDTVAFGTRKGSIYVTPGNNCVPPEEPVQALTLVQGAPILSVCWVTESLLAASDTEGRCLLWDTKQAKIVSSFETLCGEITCSLLLLPTRRLAGLVSSGNIIFWDPLEKHQMMRVEVLPSPAIGALVQMVYWPSANSLACPCEGGNLALLNLENNDVRILNTHEGDLYAVTVCGEKLLTAGMNDRRLKIWSAHDDAPVSDLETPKGAISAAVIGAESDKIVLIDKQGVGIVYSLEKQTLRFVKKLAGKDYRMVTTLPLEKIAEIQSKQKAEEVYRIIAEIHENAGRVPDKEVEGKHDQLSLMGYEHISLALRAEMATQKGEIVEALRYSCSLLKLIPKSSVQSCMSQENHANLLHKTWLLKEADEMCKHISSIKPDYPLVMPTGYLAESAQLMKNASNLWVIEPDMPILDIIESASIIGKRFHGRYLINSLGVKSCGEARIKSCMIAEKYEKIRKESGESTLPEAAIERVSWLTRDTINETEIVRFGQGLSNGVKGLQLALKVLSGEFGTEVTPIILFDWRDRFSSQFISDNEMASSALAGIMRKELSNTYLSGIHKVVTLSLRMLVSENLKREFG